MQIMKMAVGIVCLMTTSTMAMAQQTQKDSGSDFDLSKIEFNVTPELRAKANETMDQATVELQRGLEKLKPKYEMAKTEAEKNVYVKGAWLLVQKYFYKAEKIDIELAQKIPGWSKELSDAGYPIGGQALQLGEPVVVFALATGTAIGIVNNLIIGPFKAILGAVGGHFKRREVGLIRKLVTSVFIPFKAIGNLLVLGTSIAADSALVYFAGEHVYATVISANNLNDLIKSKDEKIARTQRELDALQLVK